MHLILNYVQLRQNSKVLKKKGKISSGTTKIPLT